MVKKIHHPLNCNQLKKAFRPVKKIHYNPSQLKMGIKVEKEHTKCTKIARIIAKHHLAENKNYYNILKKYKL